MARQGFRIIVQWTMSILKSEFPLIPNYSADFGHFTQQNDEIFYRFLKKQQHRLVKELPLPNMY